VENGSHRSRFPARRYTLIRVKANRWVIAAFAAAVLGAVVAAFAPLGERCSASSNPVVGVQAEACRGISQYSVDGAWVLVVVSVPVLVALLAVVVPRRPARVASSVLLWIGCVVGLASVGMFFIPAAILMTITATGVSTPHLDVANMDHRRS
jgi:drug/metabolite transporter (DMT)-like permease